VVGVAVNNVIPLRAGDAVRVLEFREQLRVPTARLFGSLFLERVLDLTILVGVLLVGIASFKMGEIPSVYTNTAVLAASGVVFAWVGILFARVPLQRALKACIVSLLRSPRWISAAEHQIDELFAALDVMRSFPLALGLIVLSITIWMFEGAVFVCVATGLTYDGRTLGPWFALATGTLSTLIPSSPGYVGTFDFFTLSGFMAFGGSRERSVAATLVVHLVLWIPLTAVGIIYLLVFGGWNSRNSVPPSSGARGERA
jgi:uncharacterized protein (TIRG00374 family)